MVELTELLVTLITFWFFALLFFFPLARVVGSWLWSMRERYEDKE